MFLKSSLFTFLGIIFAVFPLQADTIYLKNGRTIEGFITEEKPESILVDVGFGKVGLKRSEIESVSRSDDNEAVRLRDKWSRQKTASEERAKEEKLKEELAPKHATITDDRGQLVVEALLNQKVKATFILDTGASLVVIKDSIAKQLGLEAADIKQDLKIKLADGRESIAKHAVLASVSVQGVEAQNVDAAILAADVQDPSLKDGLLGMAYLKNFSFKIDQRNKKLTLEKF
ncbi:MAG: retropepsin-like aspartic protease [Candidatus Omnitrophica bacterium]|nr:retropepsin-like aspartic protease [Candidatus Omnitrophota bacterium]